MKQLVQIGPLAATRSTGDLTLGGYPSEEVAGRVALVPPVHPFFGSSTTSPRKYLAPGVFSAPITPTNNRGMS